MRPNDLYGLEAMVHPADVDDACPEWISAIAADGETYHKSGVEVVNGRDTVKYELPLLRRDVPPLDRPQASRSGKA